jgi:hypothetical protein
MTRILQLLYKERKVPVPELIAKTMPIFKNKGKSNHIKN